ncbi:MAG: nitronate monooxygenase [Bacteroidetes bacterium]|nr:nitronate monooxygenase [Bacteroidota bacterium]MBU1116624.1 nitronate monooxygenase [Bacteroidota bacterium]MBU1797741.1 nitronate monooxygenase [Bacteroidota bacterium]
MNIKTTKLFGIKYPIIQGGMVWVSGWKLASAVSNNGGLGLIGAGSMKPDLLREHIQKCKAATKNPFGVNIPLLRKDSEDLVKTTIDEGVKIVFTSAGNPAKYISLLKDNNIKVVHVVSNLKQALKAELVGCDAIVAEGVEAGGHNGADEIPLDSLITQLVNEIKIPIIAAGGIVDKFGIEKAFALGASGVQIGTLFAASVESSAHINYKEAIVKADDNDTALFFKSIGLTRGIVNPFIKKAIALEKRNASNEELLELLGSKREMLGIFNGNCDDGILEAGTGVGRITSIKSVEEIFLELTK